MNSIDINNILKYLPHRYPFLLIDRVVDYTIGEHLTAIKNVTINEPFFTGHFPGNPVMPGVLMLEALAQASVVLANIEAIHDNREPKLHLFAGIDGARFKRVVTPGDQLTLSVTVNKFRKGIWKMDAEASVDGELACSATLISAEKEMPSDK